MKYNYLRDNLSFIIILRNSLSWAYIKTKDGQRILTLIHQDENPIEYFENNHKELCLFIF